MEARRLLASGASVERCATALEYASRASAMLPLGWSRDLKAQAAARLVEETAMQCRHDLDRGTLSALGPTLAGAWSALRPHFSAAEVEGRMSELERRLNEAVASSISRDSERCSADEMATKLEAAHRAGYDLAATPWWDVVTVLVSKCEAHVEQERYVDAYGPLSRVQACLGSAPTPSAWAPVEKMLERCLIARGMKVPKDGDLRDYFSDAGYIVLDPDAPGRCRRLDMHAKIEHRGKHTYGSAAATDTVSRLLQPVRHDAEATIEAGIVDAEGRSLVTLTVTGTKAAPPYLTSYASPYNGSRIGPTTQEDIDSGATRDAIAHLLERLAGTQREWEHAR